jgi:glycosyltransferase involved in cell wall biosynthesis
MPEFFSVGEANMRSALPKKVARNNNATLILSSFDALSDFNRYFPDHVCKVKVLRFASALPDFSEVEINMLRKRYGLHKQYFICSNQFWHHKNHKLVLQAADILRSKKLEFEVVFTGKNFDYRSSGYYEELMEFVEHNELTGIVRFLGFIDRKEQLCLAKHSISYIQPSLFEGWSTTVEDAKSLNKYVLLSDIPVHREQLDCNVSFFNPNDPTDLAQKMELAIEGKFELVEKDYLKDIKAFGQTILEVFT